MVNKFRNLNACLEGVYRRPEDLDLFIDVNSVDELRSHSFGNELVIGGNVNLTETMEILSRASESAGFEYCKHLVKHIDLIANVPVRNVRSDQIFPSWYINCCFSFSNSVRHNCWKFEYQTQPQRVPVGYVHHFGRMWCNIDYCRKCHHYIIRQCRWLSQNRYDEKGFAEYKIAVVGCEHL